MTRPYRLSTHQPILPNSPLHWSRFWPDLQRLHKGRNEARQDLVIWLANLHHSAIHQGKPLAFCEVNVRLMDLRELVRDYRPALDYFFTVKQAGFYIDEDNFEVSKLIPKSLPKNETKLIEVTARTLKYEPPAKPDDAVISKVYLQPGLKLKSITKKVLEGGRGELIPAVMWLLEQPGELNFHFKPSGKLKLRDTSVWPISGIETWPGWLRELLFGPGIDLDAAYIQFLLQRLRGTYTNPKLLKTLYPDLVRLLDDKEAFRKELCTQVLQRPYNEKNRSLIKQVIMSLANGSRISPALLTNGSGFSLTAELIIDSAADASTYDLTKIGARLQTIAKQFSSAKRVACISQGTAPSRQNIKKVFSSYFTWERAARYALWEAVDRHGIMVHDGLDGIPDVYRDNIETLVETLGLKLTV